MGSSDGVTAPRAGIRKSLATAKESSEHAASLPGRDVIPGTELLGVSAGHISFAETVVHSISCSASRTLATSSMRAPSSTSVSNSSILREV